MRSPRAILTDYCLYRDLRCTTEKYYDRTVNAYVNWTLLDPARNAFTPENVSRFLKEKQLAGAAPYYLRSLRNGLRALLNFVGETAPVRSVRVDELANDVWSKDEIARLVANVDVAIMPKSKSPKAAARRDYWRTAIPAGWFTGLSQGDLWRLDKTHVAPDGSVTIGRSRTGKRATVWLPPHLVQIVRAASGPPWALQTSAEYFRREFGKIVAASGLQGTFKKLRKSSGTQAEIDHPGRGHVHLANSRKVFEQHYLSKAAVEPEPLKLPEIGEAG